MERAADDNSHYSNRISNEWSVYFNPNVTTVTPSLNNVVTEKGWDVLKISSWFDNRSYTGTVADGFADPQRLGGSTTSMPNRLDITWNADTSVNMASTPRIDQFRVLCTSGNAAPVSWTIDGNVPIQGVLVGTDDVHYYKVHHTAGQRLAISVDVLAASAPNVDLDLFVSMTNQFPDGSSYDYIDIGSNQLGVSRGGGAFVFIPSHGTGDYYVAVHSFTGAAHYVLHASKFSTTSKTDYTVCDMDTPFDPSAPYWANYTDTLKKISGRVAQYTSGSIWPLNWVHRTIPSSTCGSDEYCGAVSGCDFVATHCGYQSDVGLHRTHMSDPRNTSCSGKDNYSNPTAFSVILAHEFGHSQFGFADEYNSQHAFCGHSIMNGPSNSKILCVADTHCMDPARDSSGNPVLGTQSQCGPYTDAWAVLKNIGTVPYAPDYVAMGTTPDEWDSLRLNQWFLNKVTVTP